MITLTEFFNKYDRLARQLAQKFATHYNKTEYDDLYQEACIAIINTYSKFDHTKKSTYIYKSIINHLHRVVLGKDYEFNKINNQIKKLVESGLSLSESLKKINISNDRYLKFLSKPHIFNIMEDIVQNDENLVRIDILDQLSKDEQDIFKYLEEGKTINELALIYNISYSYMRLKVTQIIEKIKDYNHE